MKVLHSVISLSSDLLCEGEFLKAAQLCPKACRQDVVKWESWIWVFAQKRKLQIITPYLPTAQPRLGHLVYEMVLGQLLVNDRQVNGENIR